MHRERERGARLRLNKNARDVCARRFACAWFIEVEATEPSQAKRLSANTHLERKMSDANRLLYLRVALIVFGLTFIFGIYPLGLVWPSGWTWGHGHSHYLMMILSIYATLGVFLLMASQNPAAHQSIIWFTVWSSLAHGGVMTVQAFNDPAERGHLTGDAPALFLIAIILGLLAPRAAKA
jgi:hypothetical protein